VTKLICETVTFSIKEETSTSTKSFGGEEFDFRIWFRFIDETGRMDLHDFECQLKG